MTLNEEVDALRAYDEGQMNSTWLWQTAWCICLLSVWSQQLQRWYLFHTIRLFGLLECWKELVKEPITASVMMRIFVKVNVYWGSEWRIGFCDITSDDEMWSVMIHPAMTLLQPGKCSRRCLIKTLVPAVRGILVCWWCKGTTFFFFVWTYWTTDIFLNFKSAH